jgi:hypothetical protein
MPARLRLSRPAGAWLFAALAAELRGVRQRDIVDDLTVRIRVPDLAGIGQAAAALAEAFRPLQEQFEEISRRWRHAYPRMLEDADRLGRMGWTMPMWGDPRLSAHLVHEVGPALIDDYFMRHYRGPRARESKALLARVTSTETLRPWHMVLAQAASAHRSGLHLVVVPALLLVLEGSLAATAGELQKPANARRHSKLLADSKRGRVSGIVLVSLLSFVDDLFNSWSFASDPPKRLNRHWILHGRATGDWAIADALRLWHALDSLAEVI